eukprot:TRINITY_DN1407_c0_g1_i4.p1 TRINITY_DN1407_c0_g1~~TRINITY_DN1407_c0_g1_i4.p1  ORF type:complete len:140 (-),score=28.87 TRINITY_DN1407_c0_g1_i4:4-423(-)
MCIRDSINAEYGDLHTCNMKQVAILLAVAAVAFAAPTNQCASAIQAAGVSTRFDETIAHAIHSITLNELQKFNPTATAQNGVPTVNRAIAGLPADKVVADAPQLNIPGAVSYTHLRAHETVLDLVCRLLLEKKKKKQYY